MRPFTYERAESAAGAAKAAAETPGAKFLAGGTNLLDLMKLEIERPAHLIDVGRLPLADIAETAEGGLRIGAMASNSAAASDRRVRTRYPVLTHALVAGASAQLRNKATVGGNLMQRTRCSLLLRPRQALQQTRARRRLQRASAAMCAATPSWAPARPASRPTPPTWPWRSRRWRRPSRR